MKGTVYLYEVSHPDYPTVTVPSIGPDSATVEAARRWGVPERKSGVSSASGQT